MLPHTHRPPGINFAPCCHVHFALRCQASWYASSHTQAPWYQLCSLLPRALCPPVSGFMVCFLTQAPWYELCSLLPGFLVSGCLAPCFLVSCLLAPGCLVALLLPSVPCSLQPCSRKCWRSCREALGQQQWPRASAEPAQLIPFRSALPATQALAQLQGASAGGGCCLEVLGLDGVACASETRLTRPLERPVQRLAAGGAPPLSAAARALQRTRNPEQEREVGLVRHEDVSGCVVV